MMKPSQWDYVVGKDFMKIIYRSLPTVCPSSSPCSIPLDIGSWFQDLLEKRLSLILQSFWMRLKCVRLGKGSIKKRKLEFSRFSGWGVWKSPFSRFKKLKNMLLKCIKMPKYSFKRNLFFAIWGVLYMKNFYGLKLLKNHF